MSTHGFGIHTVGDILMLVGALGVVLWLLVFAPWAPRARSRRTVYREVPPSRQVPPAGYREEVVDEVPTRRYPVDDSYDQYPR